MSAHARTLLSHLRRLAAPAASDAVLLSRWREQRDEAAFAALMARHGPMVFGVCRRILGDVQDAEDAFQATFLVLARKAANLRRPEALACFLYGIALRLARKARAAAARRPTAPIRPDTPEPIDPRPHPLDVLSGRELLALLDAEMARLPEVYRLPLLLCLLQGRTVEEAARQLGWSIGSVRGRLARGRERLRQRLTRRGLDLSVGAAALLAPGVVPEKLLAESLRHLGGPVPAAISALAGGMMPAVKLKIIGLVVVLVTAVGLGAGLSLRDTPEPQTPDAPSPAAPPPQAKDEPRRDRYGDPLPPGAIARLGSLRFRVPSEIKTLAFAPDGKTLAISSHAGLFLMDGASGKRRKRLPALGSNWTPYHLAFSLDGKRLLTGPTKLEKGGKSAVHVRDLTGERPPREYAMNEAGIITWLGWSSNGDPLALRADREAIYLDELASGKTRRFVSNEPAKMDIGRFSPFRFAYAPAGQTLASLDDTGIVRVWDARTGRQRGRVTAKNSNARSVAISRDGRKLATLGWEAVHLWDAATGKLLHTVATEQKYLTTIAFAPDGKTVATASGSGIRFWDVATGREKGRCQGEGADTECIAFSGDGRTLVTAERNMGALHLWDVATGKEKTGFVGHRDAPYGAEFSPDGRRLVSCRCLDGAIHIWDTATGASLVRISRHPQWVRDAVFSADGRSLFSTWLDDQLWICDSVSGERRTVLKLEDPERPDTEQSAWAMHLSDDGKTLMAFSYYHSKKKGAGPRSEETLITAWDTSTHRQQFRRRRPGRDSRMALSADTRVLAAPYPPMDEIARRRAEELAVMGRSVEQTLRLEDAATGEPLLTFPMRTNPPSPLAFSPDGRLLAANHWQRKAGETTATVQLWETATAAVAFALPGAVHGKVAFSPEGRLLALTAPSQEIRIWDLRLDRERRRFKGFDAEVTYLAFSPDGRRLVSGLNDSTLLIWDVGTPASPRKLGGEDATKAWTDLASADAPRAFRARGVLSSAPVDALRLLSARLHPAKAADPQRLRRLLVDLESEEFTVREKAQEGLAKLGDLAEPALRQTLENKPTLEVRRRVQALLERLRGPVTRPELLQALRAVAVLEDIGTSEARRLLEQLANGAPEARLTVEAKASLQRLKRRAGK
jgi:RNA polymerase sigma factor (sigma-70 family)